MDELDRNIRRVLSGKSLGHRTQTDKQTDRADARSRTRVHSGNTNTGDTSAGTSHDHAAHASTPHAGDTYTGTARTRDTYSGIHHSLPGAGSVPQVAPSQMPAAHKSTPHASAQRTQTPLSTSRASVSPTSTPSRIPQGLKRLFARRSSKNTTSSNQAARSRAVAAEHRGLFRAWRRSKEGLASRQPGLLSRSINAWWNRLISAVFSGSFAQESAQYLPHQTRRDYLLNTAGQAAWGALFPLTSMVAAQSVGAEQAGWFSLAYVVSLMLFFVGSWGMRTLQVSDLDDTHSFSDYQLNRIGTVAVMVVLGFGYLKLRGYTEPLYSLMMGLIWFRAGDALADVYEGRLQQQDKLYLAGLSQLLRCGVAMVAFSLILIVTKNLVWASYALAGIQLIVLLLVTIPLAYFETEPSTGLRLSSALVDLTRACWPAMTALLLYNLIDSMPKFAMEGTLSYDNQLYYNALYFPAHTILMISAVIYRPQLVRLATIWADPDKHRRFALLVAAMCGVIVALALLMEVAMATVGVPLMSLMYGIDFEQFRYHAYLMVASGGICALIDFIYNVICVARMQGHVTRLYLITFVFSIPVCLLMIGFSGLTGAVLASIVVMSILLLLIVNEFLTIHRLGTMSEA